jgi:hypothetical protein
LLNGTVCTGVRITAVTHERLGFAVAGYKITRKQLIPTVGIPLTLGKKVPRGYIGLSYRLRVDDQQRYLMVESSFMGLFLDHDLKHPLLHYDYERDKPDGYPEAHLQVCATSDVWDSLGVRPLERLHLPVGGRRYRPTLEDFVEFLITEGLADGREQWADIVKSGRDGFHERQLRAAIRRNPQVALDILREEGHLNP